MAARHVGLADRFAERFAGLRDPDNVLSAVMFGIVKAARAYRGPDEGFEAFAWPRVRACVARSRRELAPVPTSQNARSPGRVTPGVYAMAEAARALRRAPSELLSRVPSREPGGPDAQAARIDLDQAIGRLSERRQFIVRAFMDGMNGEAIGRSLGIHRNSVYVHLKHAFAKLREDLRDYREAF